MTSRIASSLPPVRGSVKRLFQMGWGALLVVLLAGAPSCTCEGQGGVASTKGQLELVPTEADFGQVIIGQQKELKITAKNVGRTPINIKSIGRSEGFPEDFRFAPASLILEGGAEQQIQVFFTPKEEGEKKASLSLVDDASQIKTELPLKGTGVKPVISVDPASLDFGIVVVGDVQTKTATIKNEGNGALDVLFDPIESDHPEAFAYSLPGTSQQSVHIEVGQTAQVSVSFQPGQVGAQTGSLVMKPCSSCAVTKVALKGEGAASALLATPNPFDFGAVLPKTKATKTLTLKNIGSRAIQLKSISSEATGTPFTVGALPTTPVNITPGASIMVDIEFAPKVIGPQSTRLVFESDDPRVNATRFPISGYGGGGTMNISPSVMDFGYVGIGFPVTRRLTVTNTGISDPTTDLDNLVISSIEAPAGMDFDLPNGAGPITIQPGQRAIIDVRFNPAAAGKQEGNLVLQTNDAAASSAIVKLKGEGVLAANCSYTVKPDPTPGIQFGMINRGLVATQSFSIHNIGLTDCIVGKIDLTSETDAAFTLVEGPMFGVKLGPGERLIREVKFAPAGSTDPAGANFAGVIDVEMSSGSNPQTLVQVSGRSGEVCVTITPSAADFGVVKPMCETNDRTFRIYNACSSSVTVNQILPGAGQTDFRLILPATFPITLDPQTSTSSTRPSSMTFSVRYRPTDVGPDLGTVQVFTSQSSTSGQPYVISLTGRGDYNATASESFTQADRAAADILIVVDDSGSMGDKQDKLSKNFSNFMDFALQQQIDYHMAATSTGTDSDPWCSTAAEKINGQFMPLTGPDRIITTQTLDPAKVFARNVKVGTIGCATESGLEGAYRALSDPNINGTNSGFLRPDAYLSIIVVTDAEDQGNRTIDFYQDFFQNLKGPRGANMVSVSAVADTDPTICSQTGVYTEGSGAARYIEIAKRTGGIARSICLDDWAQALRELGLAAFGYKSRFILNSEPDPSTVSVKIDGEEVENTGVWAYTPDANSIDFLPTAVPPAGSKIEVSYTVACH